MFSSRGGVIATVLGAAGLLFSATTTFVNLQQALERTPELVALNRVRCAGPLSPVDALPAAVEVVEAVIFLVDDDDVLDAGKAVRSGRRGPRRRGHDGGQRSGYQKRTQQRTAPR